MRQSLFAYLKANEADLPPFQRLSASFLLVHFSGTTGTCR